MNTKRIDDSTPVSSSKLLGECSINPLKTKINPAYIKQSDYTVQYTHSISVKKAPIR